MSSFTRSFGDDSRSSPPIPSLVDDDDDDDDIRAGAGGYEPPLPSHLTYSDDANGSSPKAINEDAELGSGNGPILPSPIEMEPEEGLPLREWRRENAMRLEEKVRREKEIVKQIIEEADEFKVEFYNQWKLRVENNRVSNREKEKIYVASQEKFHAEASQSYWRSIGELIPKEVPTIEKKGKKLEDTEKKPSVVVIQGPKPGKPTDLTRMRQILLRLKHKPPSHMKAVPAPASDSGKDPGTGQAGVSETVPSG